VRQRRASELIFPRLRRHYLARRWDFIVPGRTLPRVAHIHTQACLFQSHPAPEIKLSALVSSPMHARVPRLMLLYGHYSGRKCVCVTMGKRPV
jgi:hypothetical protein